MSFWDSSAIIPILSEERSSVSIINFFQNDASPIMVWWGTVIECHSAISRLRRMDAIDESYSEKARAILEQIRFDWTEVNPEDGVREEAIKLLKKYPLKAADALQLAAALVWADYKPEGKYLVCLDDRLRDAARIEGFSIFPEKLASND